MVFGGDGPRPPPPFSAAPLRFKFMFKVQGIGDQAFALRPRYVRPLPTATHPVCSQLCALCCPCVSCTVYVFLLQAFVSFKYILSHFRQNTGYCRLIVQNSASDFDSEGSLSPALLISVMVWSSAA